MLFRSIYTVDSNSFFIVIIFFNFSLLFSSLALSSPGAGGRHDPSVGKPGLERAYLASRKVAEVIQVGGQQRDSEVMPG